MKQILPTGLILAAVTVATFFLSSSIAAQTPTQQPVESATLILPEAPEPQAIPPATPPTSAQPAQPPATAAPSSSSSSPQTTPPATATTPQTPEEKHAEAERELKVQEKQRLLGVMPQFQVVMGGTVVPLTPGEKWRLAMKSAIDPFYIGWAFVIGGGYGELSNSSTQRDYGWGPAGYFKRVGSNYADNVNGAIIGNALLPSVLHQDPRYFRKGTGSVPSRFVYAALSTVICHGDNGKHQFNASNVLGNFISGAISNAYYPASQRGVGLTLENGADVTLFGALGGQVLEFGPDLARLVTKKKHPAPITPTAPTAATPTPTTPTP